MDNKTMLSLLKDSLYKLGFKNYGQRLFYIEFGECIVVLMQSTYLGCAELYFQLIIKKCHPEIVNITKNVLTDKMLLDNYGWNRLEYNLYDIPENQFDGKINEIYNRYIASFENGVIQGVTKFNDGAHPNNLLELFIDSAEIIGKPEWAGKKGHDWYLTDEYILVYEYGIDIRYVNENTQRYLVENVIRNIPSDLKGKAITKWCNERCRDILIKKGKNFFVGYGLLFPFVDGKPLKYCGCNIMPPNNYQIYYNEDTNETFHYHRTKLDDGTYGFEIEKVPTKQK